MTINTYSLTIFPYTQLLTLTLLLITLQTPTSYASTPPKKPFSKIYAFGDSFTDTGNKAAVTRAPGHNYASNFPYGITFFHKPTDRHSDGRLVIDFVAEFLHLPLLPPSKTINIDKSPNGANFAVAGSTAIEYSFFAKRNITIDITKESLGTELIWFNNFLEKKGCGKDLAKCNAVFNDALVWVGEIGGNDYGYASRSSVNLKSVLALVLRRISGFLEVILKKGAKYVAVQGLPPTGCLTLSMILSPKGDRDDMGCVGSINMLASAHNKFLQAMIEGLRKQYPKAVILYADYYNAYREIMLHQSKYGIEEPFKVCCGSGGGEFNYDMVTACGAKGSKPCSNPSQYINWDGIHLTEGMYKAVAKLLLIGGYSHPDFQQMINKKMGSATPVMNGCVG